MNEITSKRLSEMATTASVLAIDGKVLDVTEYLDEHPGGREVIEEYSGTDASGVFNDIGHSKTARALLTKYEVGEYDEGDPSPPPKYHSPTTLGPALFFGATAFGVIVASIAYFVFKN
jgi:cytochrome b involved in lipid metabolism